MTGELLTILDPPGWFWRMIDRARKDKTALRASLHNLDQEDVELFYGYVRDLATSLTGPAYVAHMLPGISDTGEFETGVWVVARGREAYRETVADPSKVPSYEYPEDPLEAHLLEAIFEVYYERFGQDLPTDVQVLWQPDGSAVPQ